MTNQTKKAIRDYQRPEDPEYNEDSNNFIDLLQSTVSENMFLLLSLWMTGYPIPLPLSSHAVDSMVPMTGMAQTTSTPPKVFPRAVIVPPRQINAAEAPSPPRLWSGTRYGARTATAYEHGYLSSPGMQSVSGQLCDQLRNCHWSNKCWTRPCPGTAPPPPPPPFVYLHVC